LSAKAKESWASDPGLLGLAVKECLGGGLEGNWPQAHILEKRLEVVVGYWLVDPIKEKSAIGTSPCLTYRVTQ